MTNSRTVLIISILALIVSLLGGIVSNVASSALPESWKPHLWLAWPIFGVFLVISIALLIWQVRAGEVKPLPPSKPPYFHEGWFLKHYYLAQDDFTGRKSELDFLTSWLQEKNDKPLLVLLALGGFGKSSLVWHWLNHEDTTKNLTKVVWWGFYEDNSFETFLKETLEYLDIDPKALTSQEQVEMLARYIHQNKILIVMDGFERALRAYNSMNAAYQGDEENKNEVSNNQCMSISAGNFLKRVASINAQGRVLLTTRLMPDDLKIKGSENLVGGCLPHNLDKLSKEDAVEFIRKQKIKGTRAEIESACEVYGYHPLSLRLLAGRIIRERSRDIRSAEQFKIDADLKGRQNHILKVAYDSLPRNRQLLLSKIAAFRTPMDFEAIKIFQIQSSWLKRLFFVPQGLQTILNDFVERGLLHHDPAKDKYDLHPIVRRYAYERLTAPDRAAAHERLVDYFEAVPKPEKVKTLEDLAPVIELYHHMVRAGNLDEAVKILQDRLVPNPLFYQFGAYQLCIELLRALFLDGEDKPPRLKDEAWQAWTLNALANSYSLSGQPRRAVPLFLMGNEPDEKSGNKQGVAIGLGNVADDQLKIGALSDAERNLRRRIDLCREIEDEFNEAIGHQELGRVLSYRGAWEGAEQELDKSLELAENQKHVQMQGVTSSYRALRFLLLGRQTVDDRPSSIAHFQSAIQSAQRALELADEDARTDAPTPRDYVDAYRLLGAAYCASVVSMRRWSSSPEDVSRPATELKSLTLAEGNLFKAINQCRQINLVESEADILLDLARLSFDYGLASSAQDRLKHMEQAKSLADEALLITERSGYVLQGADVNLFLAALALEGYTLERFKYEGGKELSDKEIATLHAKEALKLATCDGPPYYYKVAYEEAERLLEKLEG